MKNPLVDLIEIIKTGSREEIKVAQKVVEKYWHNEYLLKRHEGEKNLAVFLEEIKHFDKIKDTDHQFYFLNTLKWAMMSIGRENFEAWSKFILEQIQNPSGKIRQAVINATDNLMMDLIFDLKFGTNAKMTQKEKQESAKIKDLFGNFVAKVIELQNQYYEPKFNRYKYISSLPIGIFKSITKLLREVLLRSEHYNKVYEDWVKDQNRACKAPKNKKPSILENAIQLKIILKNTKPPIWRRVIVPENYNLHDLHKVIQLSFDWCDYHLHGFEIKGVNFRLPDPENDVIFGVSPDEREITISGLVAEGVKEFNYEYDFGDGWGHRIEIEKVLKDKKIETPVCIAGKNAAPFEDSGGPWGYYEKVEIIKNPKHKEHKEILEWAGFEDLEDFDPEIVEFDIINENLENIEDYEGIFEQK